MIISEKIKTIANKLQDWRIDTLGATEVLTWIRNDEPAFAFRGPALRIENQVFGKGMLDNREHHLDLSIQVALGLNPVKSKNYGIDGGAGQTLSEPDVHYSEVTDSIGQIIAEQLDVESVHVTIMPKEGSPWNPGDKETQFWNARSKRIEKGRAPKGVTEIEFKPGYVWFGVDLCKYSDVVIANKGIAVAKIGPKPRQRSLDLLTTHCFNINRAVEAAESIRSCGGLLFPSLAIGEVPATQFGALCLVFRSDIVLERFKKRKGNWPIVIYDTNVWTGTTYDFLSGGSIVLFEQLTGAWIVSPYSMDKGVKSAHQWILGPPLGNNPIKEVSLIKNVSQLTNSMKKISKVWKRDLTLEQIKEIRDSVDRYPYLEAKSSSVVSINSAPLALCPDSLFKETSAFLSTVGWKGDLIKVPTPKNWREMLAGKQFREDKDQIMHQYAWKIHDLTVSWAEKNGLVGNID